MPRHNSKQAGVAMIMALLFSALLVAVVAIVAASQEEVAQARINKIDTIKAKNAAYSGLQLAITTLATQPATSTLQTDQWNNLGGSPSEPGSIRYDVGNESFRIQIIDGCSLIDLNTAPTQQLQLLPLTQAQVDSLIDWRQQGQTPQPDGAKDSFYLGLPNPYLTKLGRIDSLSEVLLIDGFTPATLFDTPTQLGITSQLVSSTSATDNFSISSICTVDALSSNSASSGTGGTTSGTNGAGSTGNKIDINSTAFTAQTLIQRGIPGNLANEIFSRRPIRTLAQLLTLPGITTQNATTLLNDVTTTTSTTLEGKIDINTASETVLTSLPGMTSTIAQQIITQQQQGFTSLGSLFSISGVTPQVASQFIDYLCTSSETFIVHIIGTSGTTNYPLTATIQLNGTTPKIIKINSSPFPNMALRWQWYDAQQDVDAVNSTTQTVTGSSSSSASGVAQ